MNKIFLQIKTKELKFHQCKRNANKLTRKTLRTQEETPPQNTYSSKSKWLLKNAHSK